jgi:hypothetical protein
MLWFAQGSASLFLMVAELRGQERQAAEELASGKTHPEKRKILAASPGRSRSPCC